MPRVFPILCAVLIALAVCAQESSPTPGTSTSGTNGGTSTDDIRVLRQLIEQQSRQIESLTQEITALKQTLELNRGMNPAAGAPSPSATQNMPPVQESNAPTPAPAGSAPGAEPPKTTAGATPSPAEGGLTHVVAKGETLISIAKHYKVSVADLLKMNKITDERKLQI